ncbi:MAG: hypothetical protein P1U85_17765 [Verrucomicrobiales bacterium]|nr:hypothetical protein [Verrucomicrobiales bacterium]
MQHTGILAKWIAAFFITTLLIWGATAMFTQNYYPKTWSRELARNVPVSGWSFSGRSEGWAETHFGAQGLVGMGEKLPEGSKVLIWGDSFVEAFHVPDHEKMHRQLTEMLGDEPAGSSYTAVAMGQSWWSVADHFFRIPEYERLLGDVRLHVIHLFTLDDVYPDQYEGAKVSLFRSEPKLHFEKFDNEYSEIEPPAESQLFRDSVFRARLHYFLRLKNQIASLLQLQGLRFSPGNHSGNTAGGEDHRDWDRLLDPEWVDDPAPLDAWQFVLDSLRGATDAPILFVYAPATPSVSEGEIVTRNPEASLAQSFGALCRQNEFGFINLENRFLEHWQENGAFHRGFHTSRPWEGHYNAEGHRIVAEAITQWIKENPDVVHPD